MIKTRQIIVSAYGPANLFDLNPQIVDFANECALQDGNILAFSIGSTGALIDLVDDEKIKDEFLSWTRREFPFRSEHRHPGNAFAHLRSAFLGAGTAFPVQSGFESSDSRHVFLLENTAGRKARRISLTAMGRSSSKEETEGGSMKTTFKEIEVESNGWIDLVDLTREIDHILKQAEVEEGLALIYAISEKTSLITLEYEPSLILDTADEIAHWFNNSGSSPEARGRIASAFLGRDLFVPITEGYLDLGTWQQIVLVDLGEKGSKRILVQLLS